MKDKRSEEAWRDGGIKVPELDKSAALLLEYGPADVAAVTADAKRL